MEIAVIDLETTGFSPGNGDRIIEIGIVFLNSRLEHVRTFESLVNPERPVSSGVHGISPEELTGSPTFSQLFDTLLLELGRTSCLVAHNISFEMKFLRSEFGFVGSALPDELQQLCTMKAARELGIGSNQKLPTLIKEMGISMTGPSHRAMPDALATAELLRRLAGSSFSLPPLSPIEWTRRGNGSPIRQGRGGPLGSDTGKSSGTKPIVGDGDAGNRTSKTSGVNAVADLSRPIQILLAKLEGGGDAASQAAEALKSQARRHGSKMEPAVEQLVPFLFDDNRLVRVSVAIALGHIGTTKAVTAIVKAFEQTPPGELAAESDGGTIHYWLASALAENESKISAKAFLSLLGSRTLPDSAKACVMLELGRFDLDNLGVKLPENLSETLERLASSDDPEVVEGALSLLGQI